MNNLNTAYAFLRKAMVSPIINNEDALEIAELIREGTAINWNNFPPAAKEFFINFEKNYD